MGKDETQYPIIVKRLFGFKRYYIDANTRVDYGFHLSDLGVSYKLQRKRSLIWKNRAWTYPSTHAKDTIEGVIKYLLWYEDRHAIKDVPCHF